MKSHFMSEKNRDVTIELFRLCMMFGIVLLHVITQDGYLSKCGFVSRHFINVLSPCVEGFVFISGYFSIKVTLSKIIRLISLMVFYAAALGWMYGFDAVINRIIHDWFLYGYIVLMLFSPIINCAVEVLSWRSVSGLLFAVYVWSYLCVIPIIKDYVPCPIGFAPLSFFTMFGIYTAARLYRKHEIETLILRKKLFSVVIALLACVFVFFGFHHHNSLASLALICIAFAFVRRVHIPDAFRKVIFIIAPTTFGIYLIHSSPFGHYIRRCILDRLVLSVPLPVAWVISALIVFLLQL